MAEWPVKVITSGMDHRNAPVAPGETVTLSRVREPDGGTSYIVLCPRCGIGGYCAKERWRITGEGNNLTFSPSILCNSTARVDGPNGRCGGHFFLTNGILREV